MRGRRKGNTHSDAVQVLVDTNKNTLMCTEHICTPSSVHGCSCPGTALATTAEARKGRGEQRRRRRKHSTTSFRHSPIIAKP